MLGELHEVLMLLPLLAVPAIGAASAGAAGAGAAGAGALGAGGIMSGISGAMAGLPLIGNLFGKKKDSQAGSLTNMQNMIGANNVSMVKMLRSKYAEKQTANYVIYFVLAVGVGIALFRSFKK